MEKHLRVSTYFISSTINNTIIIFFLLAATTETTGGNPGGGMCHIIKSICFTTPFISNHHITVCNNSCSVVEVSLQWSLIISNLESNSSTKLEILLLAITTASSGPLLQFKLLILGLLETDVAEQIQGQFTAFLIAYLGQKVYGTSELSKAACQDLSAAQTISLLISGSFDSNRSSRIYTEDLAQFLFTFGAASASTAESISGKNI